MNHVLRCHPIVKTDFVRGADCWLYDAAGRRYLDCEAGIWAAGLGHNHCRINSAARRQLDMLVHLGTKNPSPIAEEAAVALLEVLQMQIGKCVFLSSGSEAVELAVTVARRTTQRELVVTFADSYLAAFGSSGTKRNGWLNIDWMSCRRCAEGDCSHLDAIDFDRIAAFVFEPGSSSGAVRFAPAALVHRIFMNVRWSGGLLVANEVTTGLGRTGEWFGFEHYALQPDIVVLGKALGNGFPVSAVAMNGTIATHLEQGGFRYAQSHQNDPFGCAVAREVVATIRSEGIVAKARVAGERCLEALRDIAARSAIITDVRGRGLMIAIEVAPEVPVESLASELLDHGLLVGTQMAANVLRLQPPLTIRRDQIDAMISALDHVLAGSKAMRAVGISS